MSTRKRSTSISRRQLKEKVVQIYESLLKGEEQYKDNTFFWDELFLLKPKLSVIETEIQKLSLEQLQVAKPNITLLIEKCIETLDHQHSIRIVNALYTLCGLIQAIVLKTTEAKLNPISFLLDSEKDDDKIQQLLSLCQSILQGEKINRKLRLN